MTCRIRFRTFFLSCWIFAAPLLSSSVWAEPDQNQTLDFINSYCVRNQIIVSDGILSTKLNGIALVPMEMTDDEFLATRTLKLALNKLVPRAVKFGSIDGYLGQNGDQNYKHERTDSYILACKTQNCVSYTENLDGTGKFPYANRAAFHQKPLSTNDYRFRCLKAFAHLAQLNGATENSDLFK